MGASKSRTWEVMMRQLEISMVQVWLHAKRDPKNESVIWNEFPKCVRAEVIEQLAELFRANLARSIAGVVDDE